MELLKSIENQVEKDRKNLIKALQLAQEQTGYISDDAIKEIADYFSISVVEVEGVVSFYTQFKTQKPARYKISVCDGTACHIKGSTLVLNWLNEELGISPDEIDDQGLFSLETVACLGCCSLAPVISINNKIYGNLDRQSLTDILDKYREGEITDDKQN